MCQLKDGETWVSFIFRMLKEQPMMAITTACVVGISVIYNAQQNDQRRYLDNMSELLKQQTETYVQISKTITELNYRMESIEKTVYRFHSENAVEEKVKSENIGTK